MALFVIVFSVELLIEFWEHHVLYWDILSGDKGILSKQCQQPGTFLYYNKHFLGYFFFSCLFLKHVQKTEAERYNHILWAGSKRSLFQRECIEIISIACNVSALYSQYLLSGKVKALEQKQQQQQANKTSKKSPQPSNFFLYALANEFLTPDLLSAMKILQSWNRNTEIELKKRSRVIVVNLILRSHLFRQLKLL